jgi:hypothetical protein
MSEAKGYSRQDPTSGDPRHAPHSHNGNGLRTDAVAYWSYGGGTPDYLALYRTDCVGSCDTLADIHHALPGVSETPVGPKPNYFRLSLFSLTLPYDQRPIPQREPLARIIRNCCFERSMPNRDTRGCGDDPANVL